ncbi:ABC transporter permease [Clostridium oryzae]|uniref:Bacitracin export permease protein BceB n=1 Tax=Clostridium oryzae TaxID=1450648 RepID=A0A1V4ILL4_9CLOT|nr:ABC transporter permease [Clostridium oryzae]OPJ60734.1 bacitracin export permease protein BceB [Clostridium oryzae]
MYAKLALRNVKRSIKDYVIYFITLTLCVSLFYAFASLSSSYYRSNLPDTFDLTTMYKYIRYAAFFITSILIFLIIYVNNYMISRRKKEFAIHTIIGMEQKITVLLFFIETFVMGIFSILAGVIFGSLLSQVLTAIIMSSLKQPYNIYFSLYPDTMLITLLFFILIFALIGILNVRTIRKLKIIDMLNDGRKTEVEFRRSILMYVSFIILSVLSVKVAVIGIDMLNKLRETNKNIAPNFFISSMIITASIFILINIIYAGYVIMHPSKKNYSILNLIVLLLSIDSMAAVIFILKSLTIRTSGLGNEKLILAIAAILFSTYSIFGLYYCLSSVLIFVKNRFTKLKYKHENLFLFGQLTAKLRTTAKTMTIITITLLLAVVTLVMGTIMAQYMLGYLRIKATFDVQVISSYANGDKLDNLTDEDYSFISKYMEKEGHKLKDHVQIRMYFTDDKDFYKREWRKFPILAMKLSDYNKLRKLVGLEKISLENGCFTTQWAATFSKEEINKFLSKNTVLKIKNTKLKLQNKKFYKAGLGEYIYNNPFNEAIFILPDNECKKLTAANTFYAGNMEDTPTYKEALKINQYIYDHVQQKDAKTGNYTRIRLKTLQTNESMTGALSTNLLLVYGGVVLLVICFTVLSLQQLSDSMEHKDRFNVLRKLGVDERKISKLILKQMGIWFGIPALVAAIFSGIVIKIIVQALSLPIEVYIGKTAIIFYVIATAAVVFITALVYFSFTAIVFKRNIES